MKNSRDIGVDNRDLFPERKTGDCVSRVRTDSGKLPELFYSLRQSPIKVLLDNPCKLLKSEDPVIISHSAPGADSVGALRPGKLAKSGKTLQKNREFLHDSADLRLLKHNFRDEDFIWIGFSPPWEHAAVLPIPTDQGGGDLGLTTFDCRSPIDGFRWRIGDCGIVNLARQCQISGFDAISSESLSCQFG